MKLTLTLLAAFFLTLGTAQAQDSKVTPAKEKGEKVDRMPTEIPEKVSDMVKVAKQLDMTPEQKLNFKETAKAYVQEFRTIRSSKGSNDEKLAELKVLNKKREGNLKKIFTEEQYAKYKELKSTSKKGGKGKKGAKVQKSSY